VKLIRKEEETPQFFRVVGVVEADFRILGQPVDVFVPELTGSRLVASRNYGPWYTVIGRLRPGISIRQANEAARRAAIESAQLHPSLLPVLGGVAEGLHASQVAHLRPPLSALSLAVGFVLLIACVNVAALLLTAGPARMREFAIRTAIGATRGRVVRQVMLEYLMLASAGGAGGLAMAKLCVTLLPVLAPGDLPRMEGVALDWAVLLFTASVSLLSGIALGIAPAAVLARADLTRPMTGATGLFFARRHGWGDWILGAQLTLVLALMVVTGLAVRSASNLVNVDLGFRSDGVVGAEVFLGRRHYAEDRYDILQRDLMALASTIPGVTRVALVYDVPPSEKQGPDILYDLPDGRRFGARFRPITPAFFELLQIPVLAGRGFQEADRTGRRLIVNQAFARRCCARTDVVGMRMRLGAEGEFEIIGVVRDVRERGWAGEPEPTAYTFMGASWRDRPPHFWLLMKSSLHEGSGLSGMRGLLERVDPDLPVRVTTLGARMRASWAQLRFYTALLTGFSLFGVLLAAVGVHAVVSSHVNRRTREFGVRLAIGATPRAITTMVLVGALRTALLSAVAGLWLGVTAGRGLTSLLFGLKATDPTTLGAAMVLLLMVVAAAAYQPAARAGSVDPTT
jgi:putative ABC transport system permease protein